MSKTKIVIIITETENGFIAEVQEKPNFITNLNVFVSTKNLLDFLNETLPVIDPAHEDIDSAYDKDWTINHNDP